MKPTRLRRLSLLTIFPIFALLQLTEQPGLAQPASKQQFTQQFAELGTCKLESGQQIENCRLGYRTWGKLNADGSNAILFPTWFTGTSAQIAGFVGPNALVDPAKYFVIGVDALGDGVSSSPVK